MANIIPLTLPGQNGIQLNVDLDSTALYYSNINDVDTNYINITENSISAIYLNKHPEWKQEDETYVVPISLKGGEKIIYYDNADNQNIGEIKSITFIDKAVSYPNSNVPTTIIFKCGEDNMYIDYPSRAQIIGQIPQFIKGNAYMMKVVNNIFTIEQLTYLISNLTDYTIPSGVTINCNEHETFTNITINDGGTLKADINYATINNVQAVESGGKIILDWTLYHSSYDTEHTVNFAGSNTNITRDIIYNDYGYDYDLVPTSGYCSNGVFYELSGAYRFAVGSEIVVSSPYVGYDIRYINGEPGEPINYYGARLHAYDGAMVYNARIGWKGDMDIFSGAIVSGTIVDGTDAPSPYNTSRNACELTVWRGGSAVDTIVNSLGYLNGTTSGHVLGAVVNSGGSIKINTNNDKVHDNIIVHSGGYYIQSKNTIVNNLRIEGAEAVERNKYSELISSGGSIIIPKGPACNITGSGAVVSNLYISGHFNNCIYTSYFTTSGELSSAKVSSGVNINNNVNITSMTVNGGVINVYNGIYIDQLNISGGNTTNDRPKVMVKDGNTSISNLNIQDNAWVVLYNSAYASNFTISSGNITLVQIYSGATINNLTVNNGSMLISNGGIVNSLTYNNGSTIVSSGGIVKDLTIYDKTGIVISSGGIVSGGTMINSGAILKVNGGYLNSFTVSRGKLSTFSGTSITDLILSSGTHAVTTSGRGYCTLNNTTVTNMLINGGGGTIYNTTVDKLTVSREYITVASGSIISSTLFNHREMIIKSNATLYNVYCKPTGNCKLTVSGGGILNGLSGSKISSFVTTLTIYSGGTALNVTSGAYLKVINSGGEIHTI